MLRFLKSGLSQDRIFGGAVVLAITQFGASILGLIRDRILASTFPGLQVVDVYIASFRPSDLLFQVCIMAGFSVALVPLLAQYKARNNPEEMHKLLSGITGLAAVVFGVIAVGGVVAMPFIAPYLVHFEGESLTLYVRFAQLALFSNFLFVFGNAFGQYLITIQRYWIYGVTPILYTLGTVLGTLYLTPYYGAYGPMIGTLAGGVLYVLLRAIAVIWDGYRFEWKVWHPDVMELGWLMIPRMLALGALQLQLLFFDSLASGLDAGSVTINAYTRNFQSVVVGIAGIALAQSIFSLLSQAAAKGEQERYWIYLRKGIVILLLLTIPGAIALVFVAPIAARLVSLTDVLPVFTFALGIYAISIPFESMNHLLLRAYYATKQTMTPAIFSFVNGVIAIATSWYFLDQLGVYSLALGFTVGQIAQLIGLAILLPRRVQKFTVR